MRHTTALPTLFFALCTALGGCTLQGPPELGNAQTALEAYELPEDLCSCADLYGSPRLWPAAQDVYRVVAAPDLLVLAVDGELDCHATRSELLQRPDLAPLANLRPLVDEDLQNQDAKGSREALPGRAGGESVNAGERGDSNPLPAAPMPDESAEDSNPLPARQGSDPAGTPSPVDDSNPLPARDSRGHRSKFEQAALPTPLQ